MMKKMTKRRKKQIRRMVVLILAGAVLAAALMSIIMTVGSYVYHRYFSNEEVLNYDHISIGEPEITRLFLTPNSNSRPQKKLKEVKGIVIHYTANPGTDAQANRNYFESRKDESDLPGNKVSSHFIIGLKGKIIQCIPLEEIAYASNDRNEDTISIECCHPDDTGKFSQRTYASLITLCAWLCDRYELKKSAIIRHYDVTGKLCPLYYVNHEEAWTKIRDDVWIRLKDSEYHAKSN